MSSANCTIKLRGCIALYIPVVFCCTVICKCYVLYFIGLCDAWPKGSDPLCDGNVTTGLVESNDSLQLGV